MNDEQSAVADEGKGDAEVALTARRQLSALQAPFLQRDPGAASAEAASKQEIRNGVKRMVRKELVNSSRRKQETGNEDKENGRGRPDVKDSG